MKRTQIAFPPLAQHGLIAVILCLAVLLYHAPFIFNGRTYYSDDVLCQQFPVSVFARQRFDEGKFPLWNPYNFSGMPYLANIRSHLLYPPFWFLLLLGPIHIMSYIMLHYFLAGFLMYINLCRLGITSWWSKLTASIAFMFSGFLLLQACNLLIFCAYAWIPLVLLLADRAVEQRSLRSAIVLGLSLVIQLFSGGVQIWVGTVYLSITYMLVMMVQRYKKVLSWWQFLGLVVKQGVGGVIGLSVASVQILPSWELARQSVRGGGLSYGTASLYSLIPTRLLSILVPQMWPRPTLPEAMEVGNGQLGYAGISTVALAILSILLIIRERKVFPLFFAALGFLVLSLGKYSFLHPLAYQFLPGLNMLRTPVRYLALYVFCISSLAGFTLDSLLEENGRIQPLVIVSIIMFVGMLGIGAFVRPTDWWNTIGFSTLLSSLLLVIAMVGYYRLFPRIALGPIILLLTVFDLYTFGWQTHLPVAPKEIFHFTPLKSVVQYIQRDQPSEYFRVFWPNDLWVEDQEIAYEAWAPLAMIWKLSNVEGYSQLRLREYDKFLHTIPFTRALELLNVKYVLSNSSVAPLPHQSPDFSSDGIFVFRTPSYLPRAFIVQQWRGTNYEEVFDTLAQPSFNPADEVLLEGTPPSPQGSRESSVRGVVQITHYQPEEIDLSVYLPNKGVLVLSEPYFPGWECKVDGHSTKIWRANGILRAVILSPGFHQVRFSYRPLSVRIGAGLSMMGLLISMALILARAKYVRTWLARNSSSRLQRGE